MVRMDGKKQQPIEENSQKPESLKLIQQGAEAKILFDKENNSILKKRFPKKYRHEDLDKKLTKRRTKAETKIMLEASEIIDVPAPKNKPGKIFDEINMPYIEGNKLSDFLDNFNPDKQKKICRKIGESIAELHKKGIIHGDLTTSNMICDSSSLHTHLPKVYFIDFGLGFYSDKVEDKAVDLHLLKQALEAKHFRRWRQLYSEVKKGYIEGYQEREQDKHAEEVFKRIEKVEKRGRYKQ